MEDQFEYDVALSFAGEQREYVERVAKFLKSKDIRVFYDRDVQSVLWGKNLSVALEEIYLDKAQYCIIFISSDYAKKEWTCLEVSAAMERLLLIISHYRSWLTDKIKIETERFILLNLLGVLIHFLPRV